jgi:hypothetical protein
MEPIEEWERRLAEIDAVEERERHREWHRRIAVALGLPVDHFIERPSPGTTSGGARANDLDRAWRRALRLGESTAPLTDDEVSTLVELIRTGRRDDYDFLCSALGVTNGPELWTGVKLRGAPPTA